MKHYACENKQYIVNKTSEDFSESDWCDVCDGVNQSEEDEMSHDIMRLLMHEIETSEDNDTKKNEKIEWIEDSDC